MSHVVTWISSCGCMLIIHVFACWVVMTLYWHDCGHLSTWRHGSTCHVACKLRKECTCIGHSWMIHADQTFTFLSQQSIPWCLVTILGDCATPRKNGTETLPLGALLSLYRGYPTPCTLDGYFFGNRGYLPFKKRVPFGTIIPQG